MKTSYVSSAAFNVTSMPMFNYFQHLGLSYVPFFLLTSNTSLSIATSFLFYYSFTTLLVYALCPYIASFILVLPAMDALLQF